jgi:NagD protein
MTPHCDPKNFGILCDMDGVIYHGNRILPGTREFVAWLETSGRKYLFITNASERSPRELREKLARMGVDVGEEHFYTSAMATAAFLASQTPRGSAYVIGQPALTNALYEAGFSMNDIHPDSVVVGETPSYTFATLKHAASLVHRGAKLIGTNPDVTGPSEDGIHPACGALVAPIELTTGTRAYFVGKPNPVMMRTGMELLGTPRENTLIIGDRMDTDIISGIESGIDTLLVLSGVTNNENIHRFGYRPKVIFNTVGEVPAYLEK